jgi:hypothetical protein
MLLNSGRNFYLHVLIQTPIETSQIINVLPAGEVAVLQELAVTASIDILPSWKLEFP